MNISSLIPSASALMLLCSLAGPTLAVSPSEFPRPDLVFAPGTPQHYVDNMNERYGTLDSMTSRAHAGSRWIATATDGGGLQPGDPITLTWGYLAEGTMIEGDAGEAASPNNFHAWMNSLYPGGFAEWHPLFVSMFERWGAVAGITYVYEPNDDGAEFPRERGLLGVRPDVRIGAHRIDGNYGMLAYNSYPTRGDMILDSYDAYFDNKALNSLRLRNTIAHEHGHGIGLRHVCPANGTKLMEPWLSTNFDGPQHDDILGAQQHYGDPNGANNWSSTATARSTTSTTSYASIDSGTEEDWFSVQLRADEPIDVRVIAEGAAYSIGSEDDACQIRNDDSRLHRDLGVEFLDRNGQTVLASSDTFGPGGTERFQVRAPTTGRYFVRVHGASGLGVQPYRLQLTGERTANPLISFNDFEGGKANVFHRP